MRESSNEGSACDRAKAASGSERLRCEALSVKRAVSAPATAQPQWPMACAHQASGLAHRLVAGSPAGVHGPPGTWPPQLSGTQLTPSAASPASGNCSTRPVIARCLGAIYGQFMAFDIHSSRPQRPSDDGQTILNTALESGETGVSPGKLVELRELEPLASCMP